MSKEDDIDALAGECVLGSLDAAERAEVEARRRIDASLDKAVTAWERRLGPLSESEPGVQPPRQLYGRILDRISAQGGEMPGSAKIIPSRRASPRLQVFRISAGVAMAACLALAIAWSSYLHVGEPRQSQHAGMDCGGLYKEFWERFDRQTYARMTGDQLADVSRLALRAHDACAAGDEQNATAIFSTLNRSHF